MSRTKPSSTVLVRLALLLTLAPLALAAQEGDWEPLFDGKSLKGWKQVNGKASYAIVNGAIVGTTRTDTPNSFLATERSYRDFILEFEVRQDGGPTNSGVQIRSATRADYNQGRVFGPQIDIDPSERAWSGGIYDEQRRGWLYPVSLNPLAQGLYKMGEWNHYRIEAIGPSIRTWVNGYPVAQIIDPVATEGFIALQVHSIESADEAGRRIWWRNLRIRETSTPSPPQETLFVRNTVPNDLSVLERAQGWRLLWDGRTTEGWRGAYRSSFPPMGWRIEHGELVTDGSTAGGSIVTDQMFSAFELQLEFKLSPRSNSGIMYFVTDSYDPTTDEAFGLEYQLVDDSAVPAEQTNAKRVLGALFDLMPPRPMPTNVGIAPKVGEWQHARILVHLDNRVEHWLNGIKVLEYTRGSPDYRAAVAMSTFKTFRNFGEVGRGRILLQGRAGEVRFRSIKIRGF